MNNSSEPPVEKTMDKDSPLWQKLQGLRPALPHHIEFQQRNYAGESWYLLHDKSNGRFHRLNPSAYFLVSFMDGRRNLEQLLQMAAGAGVYASPEDVPTRHELIQLLQYLHVADLLVCDFPPDTRELFARQQQQRRQIWRRLLLNPLTWKFSLGNPDYLLTRCLPLAKLLASRAMGIFWLLVVGYGLLQAGNHWSQLTQGQLHKVLAPGNLLLLWFTYPALKVVHEFGHGLFTKVWGGHVNEWGVVVILGTPLPYVDASASIAFTRKRQRLMVGAAGIAVELFVAAAALLLWLQVQDGLLRDFLYNLILIGGVSTLLFNGNPLMRYDGYHLLTEALDLPNLGARANQQLHYWVRRFGYGERNMLMPAASRKEAAVFTFYALAAFTYRMVMLFGIVLVLAKFSPKLALLLALWMLCFQMLLPMVSYVQGLATNPKWQPNRKRALTLVAASSIIVLLGFVLVPLPVHTRAEGIIWLPEEMRIKAESDGEVMQQLVSDGQAVVVGQPLFQLVNPSLLTELVQKQAALREYEARYQQAWADNRAQAQLFTEDIKAIQTELELLEKRIANLNIQSRADGVFHLLPNRQLQAGQLLGIYLHQGDSLAVIIHPQTTHVRAALTQEEIGRVRQAVASVEVKLVSDPAFTWPAQILQQVPAATYELPSAALGAQGGGRLAVDAARPEANRATQMVFLVDLQVSGLQQQERFGERVYIKFSHPDETAAIQLYRALQQLFTRSFQL